MCYTSVMPGHCVYVYGPFCSALAPWLIQFILSPRHPQVQSKNHASNKGKPTRVAKLGPTQWIIINKLDLVRGFLMLMTPTIVWYGWMLIQVPYPCLFLVWSIRLFLKIQFSPLIPADAFKAIWCSRFQASDWSHVTKTQNWLVGTSICSIHRRADVAMSGIPILSYLRFISLGSLDTAQLCRFVANKVFF